MDIVLENVLEEQPEMMTEIFREVDNPGCGCVWTWGM